MSAIYPALLKVLPAGGLLFMVTVIAFHQQPLFAQDLISSDQLIEKLAMPPPVQARGLVKTTGPDISNSVTAEPGAQLPAGSVMLKIQFTHDSSQLSNASRAQLYELGTALNSKQLSSYVFEIAGHTDGTGDRDYNRQLSIRRANAVKNYLSANLGVSQYRLQTVGWGEDRPLVSKDPFHPDNRRVEIINRGH